MALIRIGHSPDADDAFMFYALTAGKVRIPGAEIEHTLEDIESLNRRARTAELGGALCMRLEADSRSGMFNRVLGLGLERPATEDALRRDRVLLRRWDRLGGRARTAGRAGGAAGVARTARLHER